MNDPISDFAYFGTVNSMFQQGPPFPHKNIDPINNPLPYWHSQGNLIWSSGRVAGEGTIEQIIPVGRHAPLPHFESDGVATTTEPLTASGTAIASGSTEATVYVRCRVDVKGEVRYVKAMVE